MNKKLGGQHELITITSSSLCFHFPFLILNVHLDMFVRVMFSREDIHRTGKSVDKASLGECRTDLLSSHTASFPLTENASKVRSK